MTATPITSPTSNGIVHARVLPRGQNPMLDNSRVMKTPASKRAPPSAALRSSATSWTRSMRGRDPWRGPSSH